MVAPDYAKHRSSLAKKIGLGTTPRARGGKGQGLTAGTAPAGAARRMIARRNSGVHCVAGTPYGSQG